MRARAPRLLRLQRKGVPFGGHDPDRGAGPQDLGPQPLELSVREGRLDAGKELGLLGLHVVLEEETERLEPRLERRPMDVGREHAPQLRAQHEVLVVGSPDVAGHARVAQLPLHGRKEDRLFSGHVGDELLGEARGHARAGVPAGLTGELFEEGFDGSVLRYENARDFHRWGLVFLSEGCVCAKASVPFRGDFF